MRGVGCQAWRVPRGARGGQVREAKEMLLSKATRQDIHQALYTVLAPRTPAAPHGRMQGRRPCDCGSGPATRYREGLRKRAGWAARVAWLDPRVRARQACGRIPSPGGEAAVDCDAVRRPPRARARLVCRLRLGV
jgi:hypothetical protein